MRNTCCIEGCGRPVAANSMCAKHYYRQRRGGNPTVKSKYEKTTTERFLERITKQKNGCWEWAGHLDNKGYGRFYADGFSRAHRFAYHTFIGPIPEGMYVCHKCDNPRCTNPDHLFVGTAHDNNMDMSEKGRHGRGGGVRKIPKEVVLLIYSLKGQVGATALGNKYGLNRNTVYAIWKQKIWKSITAQGDKSI